MSNQQQHKKKTRQDRGIKSGILLCVGFYRVHISIAILFASYITTDQKKNLFLPLSLSNRLFLSYHLRKKPKKKAAVKWKQITQSGN